jgi:hypothetical protein
MHAPGPTNCRGGAESSATVGLWQQQSGHAAGKDSTPNLISNDRLSIAGGTVNTALSFPVEAVGVPSASTASAGSVTGAR